MFVLSWTPADLYLWAMGKKREKGISLVKSVIVILFKWCRHAPELLCWNLKGSVWNTFLSNVKAARHKLHRLSSTAVMSKSKSGQSEWRCISFQWERTAVVRCSIEGLDAQAALELELLWSLHELWLDRCLKIKLTMFTSLYTYCYLVGLHFVFFALPLLRERQ